MLQAHSPLWHYLWVAPNILFLVLALLLWQRNLAREFPAFFAFAIFGSLGQLAVYTADVVPSITAEMFWRIDWVNLFLEGILKFAVVAEIFAHVFGSYTSIAKIGKSLIRASGVLLVLAAAIAAGMSPHDSRFGIVSGAHHLEQTIYFIESGLLVSILCIASYFHLSFGRQLFGITLGLGTSACVHLATWALIANGGFSDQTRYDLDFLNMATYHLCVLLWFYFLLLPHKVATKSAVSVPEHNLEVWNREMERLLHS